MKKIFCIKGMHCNSCAMMIENELEDRGIKSKIDFANEKAEVEFDEKKISEKEIKKIIEKLGYNIK
jgi:copper chaperone CopZ